MNRENDNSPLPSLLRLLNKEIYSLDEALAHATELDTAVSLNINDIEGSARQEIKTLSSLGYQVWGDLSPEALQTTYFEFRTLVQLPQLAHSKTWVDFGAAYGRLGIVLGLLRPEDNFLGYEILNARVSSGSLALTRLELKNAKLICTDVAEDTFEIPEADVYFVYDFGTRENIETVLEKLKDRSRNCRFHLIARGRGVRNIIERHHPWLTNLNYDSPFDLFAIYRT